jgi:hypothetical protein
MVPGDGIEPPTRGFSKHGRPDTGQRVSSFLPLQCRYGNIPHYSPLPAIIPDGYAQLERILGIVC